MRTYVRRWKDFNQKVRNDQSQSKSILDLLDILFKRAFYAAIVEGPCDLRNDGMGAFTLVLKKAFLIIYGEAKMQ